MPAQCNGHDRKGRIGYLRRAVDQEGEVLESYVTKTRDKQAAIAFMKKALMRPVKSMIEFKQIIGRGTRVFDGKDLFTVYEFVKAYEHVNDPEWDGEPEVPASGTGGETGGCEGGEDDPKPPTEKILAKQADGKGCKISYVAATTHMFNGRPITAQEFMDHLFGGLTMKTI